MKPNSQFGPGDDRHLLLKSKSLHAHKLDDRKKGRKIKKKKKRGSYEMKTGKSRSEKSFYRVATNLHGKGVLFPQGLRHLILVQDLPVPIPGEQDDDFLIS